MGTEYYLINKENNTFYDLGKGSWYEFIGQEEALTDLEYLEEFVFDDCLNGYDRDEDHIDDTRGYAKELASELFEFAKCKNIKNILLTSDCTDDTIIIRCLGYKCVGSRYRDSANPECNRQHIEFENRHLDPKTPKHLYSIDAFLKAGVCKVWINGLGYVPLEENQPSPYQELVDKYRNVEP